MLDLPDTPVLKGRVLYVSPVADAAAETRRVRVELPNPTALPPGTRARVRFSPPTTNPTPTPAPITTNTPAEGRK
jgi:multidrug efflux pump subunit AcrA (membrane-fusion protein)